VNNSLITSFGENAQQCSHQAR